MLVIYIIL